MLLAYNTNGLAHHDPAAAIALLAEIGYRGVGMTLDHGLLNPWLAPGELVKATSAIRGLLHRYGMRSVVETGARFLLDPRRKHEPTLMSPDAAQRHRRVDFLCRAIDIARDLESDCVSIWSGTLRESLDDAVAWARLIEGLAPVCDYAQKQGVLIGFEPEPGMFIDTLGQFEKLLMRFDAPALRLTIDVGHLHCLDETPLEKQIRRWADRLVNVHIEDMRAGVHEHLMFGEGEIDFPPVLAALAESGYARLVQVELSRHSHMAPQAARQAFEFLTPLMRADATTKKQPGR
jgi:sugar phosphate isomerase/epimerase